MVLEKDRERIRREEGRTIGAVHEVEDWLGLKGLNRMEAFDISNISGFESVGSMVVYEKGKPKRSDYRKFRIKSVQGPNDYASMEEVLTRRFQHGLEETVSGEEGKFSDFPDVLMMDALIAPALERGAWVLLDRYYLSMMAYQGARGMDVETIRTLNEEFAPIPDAVIWLDIPVETALSRIGNRGERDAFEAEEALLSCRNIFAGINEPWMLRVDANAERDVVAARVVGALQQYGILD